MKIILPFLLVIFATTAFAQNHLDAVADSITKEAKVLAQSESASWYGTDIFREKCKNKLSLSGGYISYSTGNDMKNIFFSNEAQPKVLATITFPNANITVAAGQLDTTVRNMNKTEKDLYRIRKTAIDMIVANKDTLFKFYKNIGVNPVPVFINGQKRVYVLAGPKEPGIVVFGNDYLICFDNNNEVSNIRSLHRNIITALYGQNQDPKKIIVTAMHNHLPSSGYFISATDLCTLMLYEKFTTWQTYQVISEKYVSVWDCQKNSLVILTKAAWDNIFKDQAARRVDQK